MEQFLTGDIWNQVNKLLTRRQKKVACIAYVTSDKLQLTRGDILICDASDFTIRFGGTSAKAIDTYFKRGVNLLSSQQLHSKLLLTDKFLVIGSANLSNRSAEKLTESSVVTYNAILISQAKAFCRNLANESNVLTRTEIDLLLKINVVKRPFKPTTKSRVQHIIFGNCYWFTTVYPFTPKEDNKIKDKAETAISSISERENIAKEDISILRPRIGSKFSETAKEGDQVILRFYNKGGSQSHIYPPLTILEKQVIDGVTYFYYDTTNFEKRISWTEFEARVKNIKLEKSISTRSKIISEADVNSLKSFWEK